MLLFFRIIRWKLTKTAVVIYPGPFAFAQAAHSQKQLFLRLQDAKNSVVWHAAPDELKFSTDVGPVFAAEKAIA